MLKRYGLVAVALVACGDAEAQTGLYLQMDLGSVAAPSLSVQGSDDDWGTKCDLIINPMRIEVVGDECGAQPEPSAWTNDFSSGSGIVAGAALGYDWGAVRVEAEYTFRVAAYNDESGMDIFDDVSLDKREQEIELAVGRVGDLQGRGMFANVLWDIGSSRTWTPYVGVGVGVERATLDYASVWKRNDDPGRIATFEDPVLKATLAGTTTIGDARVTDAVVGYQVLAGVDYWLKDPVSLGLRVRWAEFGEIRSERLAWDQLRSHESSAGRGGDVTYQAWTGDSRFLSLSASVKVRF